MVEYMHSPYRYTITGKSVILTMYLPRQKLLVSGKRPRRSHYLHHAWEGQIGDTKPAFTTVLIISLTLLSWQLTCSTTTLLPLSTKTRPSRENVY